MGVDGSWPLSSCLLQSWQLLANRWQQHGCEAESATEGEAVRQSWPAAGCIHACPPLNCCCTPAPSTHNHTTTHREDNIKGYIALAPPFGGSTYAIASKLGGTRMKLLDFIGDFLQPIINELVYHGSRGLPSMLMLMPNWHLWGKDFVSHVLCFVGASVLGVCSWQLKMWRASLWLMAGRC